MKSRISLLLFVALVETGFAQQDSVADVFPLTIGNKWTYDFTVGNSNSWSHTATTDTGIVEYTIIGRLPSADSTRWQFFQRRNFTRHIYGQPYQLSIQDSGSFEIVELNNGYHELYTPVLDPLKAFPFKKMPVDSARFFRYTTTDTAGNATLRLIFPNDNGQFFVYLSTFMLCKDTGITLSSGNQTTAYLGSHVWMRYYLVSFLHSPYAGPYLSHPISVSLTSLVGILKDTTVVLRNVGIDTLRIQYIASSDSALVASLPSQEIPPYQNVSLSLRYTSNREGVTEVRLILISNSTSSPDTIVASISNRIAASISLDKRNINFGEIILSSRYKDTTASITNNGNINLTLDSLLTTNPDFTIRSDRNTLAPGKTMISTIRFTPSPTFYHQADLIFFTNSLSSPDTIHVSAIASGGVLGFDRKTINFGEVKVGSTVDTVVRISALGNTAFLRVQRSTPIDPSFTILRDFPSTLDNGATYNDSIRFNPTIFGKTSTFVVYSSRSSYIYDSITATDTIWLSGFGLPNGIPTQFFLNQNYPNPFNPTTRIEFGIPYDAFVSVKVFDLLGREVATLVNEQMKAGSYERVFDGSKLASGLYLYRLHAGHFVQTKKLLLLR